MNVLVSGGAGYIGGLTRVSSIAGGNPSIFGGFANSNPFAEDEKWRSLFRKTDGSSHVQ